MTTSKISWTDKTWETLLGCTKVSPGCTNCYAANLIGSRFAKNPALGDTYKGLTVKQRNTSRYNWTGEIREMPSNLWQPFHWKAGRIFVNSRSDTFHRDVSFQYQCAMFAVMAANPQLTFQILTKRPDEMKDAFWLIGVKEHKVRDWETWSATLYAERPALEARGIWQVLKAALYQYEIPAKPKAKVEAIETIEWPLPNVWLGTSVEDQRTAGERISALEECPAVLRWLSVEPLLEEIDLMPWLGDTRCRCGWAGCYENNEDEHGPRYAYPGDKDPDGDLILPDEEVPENPDEDPGESQAVCPSCYSNTQWWDIRSDTENPKIGWVVVGGESGANHRTMEMAWALSLYKQARAAGVAFYYKQGNGSRSNLKPFLVDAEGHEIHVQEIPTQRTKKDSEGTWGWQHENMAASKEQVTR